MCGLMQYIAELINYIVSKVYIEIMDGQSKQTSS